MARACPNCGWVRPPDSYGDKELGAKLRRMREKAGLSVRQVAAMSGMSSATISAIERAERKASRWVVEPVVEALRRHARELQEVCDEQEKAEDPGVLCVSSGRDEVGDCSVPAGGDAS